MVARTNRRIQPATGRSLIQWLGVGNAYTATVLALVGLVLCSGLAVVYLTHQNRFLFKQLQALKDQANELDVQWGQLLIEQSTFGLEGRIEQKAVELLEMKVPEIDQIVVVTNE